MAFDFSCEDWAERLQQGKTPMAEVETDKVLGQCAVDFFDKLRLPDVIGQPTMKVAAGDWFRDIIRVAFGAVDSETGHRACREVFNLIPKKNSKTTNAAALGIVALLMNDTPNITGLIVGPTMSVAQTCFQQVKGMIEADEYLKKRFKIQDHKQTITDISKDPKTGNPLNAKLVIKAFDVKVLTGGIPFFAIIDELHVMSQNVNASRVIAQIRGGMITNPNSLLIFITTQSDKPPAGVFKTELQYARAVRDGKIKNSAKLLPVLYEFPEAIQLSEDKVWQDPKYWPMVLPNLGRSISLDRLIDDYETARDKGIEELSVWSSQHLNIEIGLALHTDRWIGVDYWSDCVEIGLTLDDILERSEVVTAGVDGGGLDDLFGLAVCGKCRETRKLLFWFHAWAQGDVFKQRKEIAERLRDFEQAGDLTVCPEDDPTMDYRDVTEILEMINDTGLFPDEKAVGLDPQGVSELVDNLLLAGLTEEQLVGVPQGFKLSSAIWGMERKMKNKRLSHNGSPMMNWVLGNARSEQRGNAIYVSKQAAGKAKIDPLIAGFNAFMLMSFNPKPSEKLNLADFLNNPVMIT